MENIMYEDNVPGVLGNCALLSALNILCNSQSIINTIFTTKDINPEGFFIQFRKI
jgi:hypothetical protein